MLLNFDTIKLKTINFTSTSLKKVIFDGITVWKKTQTLTGTEFIMHRCEDGDTFSKDVTFSTAFASTPSVTYTLENHKGYISIWTGDVSKTGFKIYWKQNIGDSSKIAKVYVHWTAVGEV